jgi:MFS family permease
MDIYHLGLVVWSVFESVLCTAAIFGWAQLLEILEGEQYFSSYCGDEAKSNKTISQLNTSNYINNETGGNDITTCSEQDSILRLVYTIAVFASFASIFVSGKYMDMFGFRKTRILAR